MQLGWGNSWATNSWVVGSWVGESPIPPVPPVPPTHYYNAGLTIVKDRKKDNKALIRRSDEDFLQLMVALMPFIDRE